MIKKKNKISKWYSPHKPLNWSKKDSQAVRRREALKARKGDYLATYHALDSLAKVSSDPETSRKARDDSKYFLKMFHVKQNKKLKKY